MPSRLVRITFKEDEVMWLSNAAESVDLSDSDFCRLVVLGAIHRAGRIDELLRAGEKLATRRRIVRRPRPPGQGRQAAWTNLEPGVKAGQFSPGYVPTPGRWRYRDTNWVIVKDGPANSPISPWILFRGEEKMAVLSSRRLTALDEAAERIGQIERQEAKARAGAA